MPTVAAFNVKIGANVTEFMRKINQVERALDRLERVRHGIVKLDVIHDLDRVGENFRKNMEASRRAMAEVADEIRDAANEVKRISRVRTSVVRSGGRSHGDNRVTHVLANISDALDLGPIGYFGSRAIGGALGGIGGPVLAGAGLTAATVAAIPLISAIPGAQFEYAMDRIRAKAGDAEPAILALQQRILELGASSTLSAREVAAAAEEMAAMGFTAEEVADALPGVIAAAEATGEDLGIVMETVAEALNNFQLEASEASRVADVLAEAANASAANIETMHYVMKYAAPSAKQLGMSIEDLAAAAMILADRGLEASQIGRYLRMGLSRLAAPTKQAKALMRELGIEVFNAQGKLKPFPEVIAELKEAFDRLTPSQAQAAAKTIFGTEAMTAFLMLVDEGPEKLEKYIKQLENAAGAADKMAKVLKDNLLMDLETLGGELETLAINIFGENVGWMRAGVRAATNFFEGINKAFEAKQAPGVPLDKADVLIGKGAERQYLTRQGESWITTMIRGMLGDESYGARLAAAIERHDWYGVGYVIGDELKQGMMEAFMTIELDSYFETLAVNTASDFKYLFDDVLKPLTRGFLEGYGVSPTWAQAMVDPIGTIVQGLRMALAQSDGFMARLRAVIAVVQWLGAIIRDFISGRIIEASKRAVVLQQLLSKKIPPGKLAAALAEAERLLDKGYDINTVLAKTITKYVNVHYRTFGSYVDPTTGRRRWGGPSMKHAGGIVPRVAHSGMVVPGAGTIPMRLWGGEMVLTRGQQAKLMHMLRYGFTGSGSGGQGGGGNTYNITVNARTADFTERDLMRVLRRAEMLA